MGEKRQQAIYIHVPFCLQKCRYCDFISYPYDRKWADRYLEGLLREIELRSAAAGPGGRLGVSLYIGGGTPTCLPVDYLETIIRKCFNCFQIPRGTEITVEANPGTVDKETLKRLLSAGVNRLSLGIQSCRDVELSRLGRVHSYREAVHSFYTAREAGFKNISVDMILGIPGQEAAGWLECLHKITGLGPEHISAYGLQLEEGTPLYRDTRRGVMTPCDPEEELAMFQETISTLTAAGYEHYEISNYARPGKRCRHNLIYWHNREYLGLGPAAHSYLGNTRLANLENIGPYAAELERGRLPVAREEKITPGLEMAETIFLGLRLVEGLPLQDFYCRFGRRLEEVYPDTLEYLAGQGLIEITGDRLRLTERGLPVANQVFMEFLP